MPEDRRVRRTKRALKEALLDLILERGYDRITVRDITERADVGRSTFYSHFDSKEDLLFAGFDRWLLSLAEEHHGRGAGPAVDGADEKREGDAGIGCEEPRIRSILPLLKHARTQRRFLLATLGRGAGTRVARRIREMLGELMHRELDRLEGRVEGGGSADRTLRREARVAGLVAGLVGLMVWWLEKPGRLSVGEIDRILQEMAVGPTGVAERLAD